MWSIYYIKLVSKQLLPLSYIASWLHLTSILSSFNGQKSLLDYNPRGCKELDTTEQTHILSPRVASCGGSASKNLPANAVYVGSIPGLGRSPREGSGNPLQCSCLGNPMNRGAWWATDHGATKSWTYLSNSTNSIK